MQDLPKILNSAALQLKKVRTDGAQCVNKRVGYRLSLKEYVRATIANLRGNGEKGLTFREKIRHLNGYVPVYETLIIADGERCFLLEHALTNLTPHYTLISQDGYMTVKTWPLVSLKYKEEQEKL